MHAVLTCTDPVEIDIQDHSSKYKVLYKVLKNTALCDLKLANRCWSLMVSLIYCRVATHRASHSCSLQGNEPSEGAQPVTIITVIYRLMKPHKISYNLINMRLNSWKGRYRERERGRWREREIYIYNILIYYPVYLQFTLYTQVVVLRGLPDLGQCAQHPVFAADVQDCAGLRMGWWRKSRISSIPQFEHKV